jgi:aspartate aminotransferase
MRWLLEAMASTASETYTATSAPIQYAAVRAMEGGEEIDLYLRRSRRVLRSLGRHAARRLREAGLVCRDPVGGFYLFADFEPFREALERRGLRTSAGVCARILDDVGVALLPGSVFGRREDELTARLAYVDFDGAAALDAAAGASREATSDLAWLRRCCAPVLEGLDRLALWIAALAD